MCLSSLFAVPLSGSASDHRLHSGVRTHPCLSLDIDPLKTEGSAQLGVTFKTERSPHRRGKRSPDSVLGRCTSPLRGSGAVAPCGALRGIGSINAAAFLADLRSAPPTAAVSSLPRLLLSVVRQDHGSAGFGPSRQPPWVPLGQNGLCMVKSSSPWPARHIEAIAGRPRNGSSNGAVW
jgi:hypothetical protein